MDSDFSGEFHQGGDKVSIEYALGLFEQTFPLTTAALYMHLKVDYRA